jgi:CBS domain-containing protein
MRANGIRRIPVVDEAGALVGIATADDLLENIAEQLAELARLVSRQQAMEQRMR